MCPFITKKWEVFVLNGCQPLWHTNTNIYIQMAQPSYFVLKMALDTVVSYNGKFCYGYCIDEFLDLAVKF